MPHHANALLKRFSAKWKVGLAAFAMAAALTLVSGIAHASSTTGFHAQAHLVDFQNSCTPPIVFCGSGTVAGYGRATMIVRATINAPIPGTDCFAVSGLRWITLDDGSGSLASSFTGTRCPLAEGGHAFRIKFSYTIDATASSGVFAGATGSGTGGNTTAGHMQVVSLSGTITLP
jgi:hypothetical protein